MLTGLHFFEDFGTDIVWDTAGLYILTSSGIKAGKNTFETSKKKNGTF